MPGTNGKPTSTEVQKHTRPTDLSCITVETDSRAPFHTGSCPPYTRWRIDATPDKALSSCRLCPDLPSSISSRTRIQAHHRIASPIRVSPSGSATPNLESTCTGAPTTSPNGASGTPASSTTKQPPNTSTTSNTTGIRPNTITRTSSPSGKPRTSTPTPCSPSSNERGARYFTPCAVHHDNFDLWDSKHHEWNALNMGPKKNLIGMWREAALKAGTAIRRHHPLVTQL